MANAETQVRRSELKNQKKYTLHLQRKRIGNLPWDIREETKYQSPVIISVAKTLRGESTGYN